MEEDNTFEKIEKGAIMEFSQFGFEGARIDRIAQKAKINKAMIYYHFKGKEALYEHIVKRIVSGIYDTISPLIPENPESVADFERLLRGYSSYLGSLDENYIKIMLREIASGGKYFKKITVPILLQPVMKKVMDMFTSGKKKGLFADIHPLYTMLQLVGSVVFFNMLRTTIRDTAIADLIFQEDFINKYAENLLKIYSGGIFVDKR